MASPPLPPPPTPPLDRQLGLRHGRVHEACPLMYRPRLSPSPHSQPSRARCGRMRATWTTRSRPPGTTRYIRLWHRRPSASLARRHRCRSQLPPQRRRQQRRQTHRQPPTPRRRTPPPPTPAHSIAHAELGPIHAQLLARPSHQLCRTSPARRGRRPSRPPASCHLRRSQRTCAPQRTPLREGHLPPLLCRLLSLLSLPTPLQAA